MCVCVSERERDRQRACVNWVKFEFTIAYYFILAYMLLRFPWQSQGNAEMNTFTESVLTMCQMAICNMREVAHSDQST